MIQYKYMHVNSVSVDRCIGIANLMATLEAWMCNILKGKSMEKTQACAEQLSWARTIENKLCITEVKSIQESC